MPALDQPILFGATADADKARPFYAETLGLRLVQESDFAIVFAVGELELRVQKVREHVAAPYTSLGWQVADIAASVAELAAKGVNFERYPWFEQDDAGVWTTPGPRPAKVAWFKDPDGNTLSLTQPPG